MHCSRLFCLVIHLQQFGANTYIYNKLESMRILRILGMFLLFATQLKAQSYRQWNSSEIYHHLQKLKVMGSVLYVAAHPDDENTRLITWLVNDKKLNTAYISLTRGDGGQNLIGNEFGDELGVIRTHELTQARKIDGGLQFFSRAADFGYSKTPDETFKIWKKKKVMSDLIYVVRKFQPDLIITRFNTEAGKTHGHHTASAMMANEVIELSTDTNEAYQQLPYVNTWKVQRVVWNASAFFFDKGANLDTLSKLDCGNFNSLLGSSYTEIAALSRSCHKSQGFGTSGIRGEQLEYFIPAAGTVPTNKDIFSGYDFTWNRIKNGKGMIAKIDHLLTSYNFNDPSASVESLIALFTEVQKINDGSYLVSKKLEDIKVLINQCLGFYHEVYTDDYIYAVGDTMRLKTETVNRSGKFLTYINLRLPYQAEWLNNDFEYNRQVNGNDLQKWTSSVVTIKEDAAFSNPVWWDFKDIDDDVKKYSRSVENKNFEPFTYAIIPSFNNKLPIKGLEFYGQIMYKRSDPEKGEIHQPVYLAPPVTATPLQEVLVWRNHNEKKITVQLQAFKNNCTGIVRLNVPEGWKVSPAEINFSLINKRETKNVEFNVIPPDTNTRGNMQVEVICNQRNYSCAFKEIKYDHIPTIVLFPVANVKLVKIQNESTLSSIAYIEGAGDDIAHDLREAGYKVDNIKTEDLLTTDYSRYKTVILGIRSYNTIESIVPLQSLLFSYVNRGGKVIAQYVTSGNSKVKENGPYPFKISRDRVTDENAEMRFLDPNHPVFNKPYKITEADFKGWVQERGLYFANDLDKNYTPLISCNDPNEEEKKGGLIVAKYGEGYFIYSGLSFFRQLPDGVPGAYKLFINMIELN
jgi:LmbE family N-acetylglucosaminyl deacetylase